MPSDFELFDRRYKAALAEKDARALYALGEWIDKVRESGVHGNFDDYEKMRVLCRKACAAGIVD